VPGNKLELAGLISRSATGGKPAFTRTQFTSKFSALVRRHLMPSSTIAGQNMTALVLNPLTSFEMKTITRHTGTSRVPKICSPGGIPVLRLRPLESSEAPKGDPEAMPIDHARPPLQRGL
jgi:hypothetical protein